MKQENLKQENELFKQIQYLTKLVETLNVQNNLGKEGVKTPNREISFTNKEIKQMPRLKDFKIRIKNNKYYEIRYRKNGYNVSFSSTNFETAKQKAFKWLASFEEEIKNNVNFIFLSKAQIKDINEQSNASFDTFSHDYLYNVKKKRVKANTFKTYEKHYKNHISKMFKNKLIKDIRPTMIQSKLDEINKVAPRTCEDVKMLLMNIFDYAVDNALIQKNPMKAVYIPKHEREKGQALTPTQEKDFVKNIVGTKYENVYLKMLYSGVRPCEVNEMTEDTATNTVKIKNGKLRSWQKNYYRTIPINSKYLTTIDRPITKKIDIDDLREEFKKYLPNNTLKDLRHTFTTRARECGIENELVAIWTGHSLGNITSSVYTHFSNEYQQKEALKFNY